MNVTFDDCARVVSLDCACAEEAKRSAIEANTAIARRHPRELFCNLLGLVGDESGGRIGVYLAVDDVTVPGLVSDFPMV